MKICILAEAFYPFVGGAESHSKILSRELVNNGHRVTVVTRRIHSSYQRFEIIDGAKVCRVPPSGKPRIGKYLMILPAAVTLIKLRSEYDMIYVCGLRILGIVGVLIAKLLNKKSVLRSESIGELDGEFIQTDFVQKHKFLSQSLSGFIWTRNAILKKTDQFISISSAIAQEYHKVGISDKQITIIPNGIDTERFKPPANGEVIHLRSKLNLPSKWLVSYTGKLNRGKGLTVLLNAWVNLIKRTEDIHLVLVGSGSGQFLSIEQQLKNFVKTHKLEQHVTFTGYTESVDEYLKASDCFILPSRSEGFPISLIEAMACSLPCVSTNIGGITDIVTNGEDGVQIEPDNARALECAILNLFSNKEQGEKMGANARMKVEKQFSIQTVTAIHSKIFACLLDSSHHYNN